MNGLGGIRRGGLGGLVSRLGLAMVLAAGASAVAATTAMASGEVNIYSSRHYDTDERLYSEFEEKI